MKLLRNNLLAASLLIAGIVLLWAIPKPVNHGPTLTLSIDGMSFTWRGNPVLESFTVWMCDSSYSELIPIENAERVVTMEFDIPLEKVVGSGGDYTLVVERNCVD